jgi:mono/diheme cytochrome c family protein
MSSSLKLGSLGKTTGICLLAISGIAFAQEDIATQAIGKREFQKNCAACHGLGGKGDGPFVEFLKMTPPDLTQIRKNNEGIFPHTTIYDWIRDPERIRAHGTRDMPVWGERYSQEIIEKYGPYYSGPGSSVSERILELVFYLATIQE